MAKVENDGEVHDFIDQKCFPIRDNASYFPVLCALKLRMTLINEDKERHFQNSMKRVVSHDTKLGAQSITVDRQSLV